MRLIIREKAAADIAAIFEWIARDNPRAAAAVVRRIRQKLDLLLTPGLAYIGRAGHDAGTRELVEGPYIIVYEVDESPGTVSVLAIFHGAQDRKG